MLCRICKIKIKKKNILKLKNMPPSAQGFKFNFTNYNKKTYNFSICEKCNVPQILNNPVRYYKETIRSTNLSKELIKIRTNQFQEFVKKYNLQYKKTLEIGCNKGENLNIFKKFSKNVFGVEYNKESYNYCRKSKLNVFRYYLGNQKIKIPHKPFDAFFILNFLEHIPDLNIFFKTLKKNLNKNYVGIIEVPNFNMIEKKGLYTELIIDHLYYFNKVTFKNILKKFGFKVLKINTLFHGYILSATVINDRKSKYINKYSRKFNVKKVTKSLNNINNKINKFLNQINKKKFIVWGAGHQSLTIISYFKLQKYIPYLIDSSVSKQNKFIPGSRIKVFNPSKLAKENDVGNILVIAGGYSQEITKLIKSNFKKFNIYIFDKNNILSC